jgi:hypothetical protein
MQHTGAVERRCRARLAGERHRNMRRSALNAGADRRPDASAVMRRAMWISTNAAATAYLESELEGYGLDGMKVNRRPASA